jgi:hypothetical protein
MLFAATIFVLSWEDGMAMGNSTHASGKGAVFIFGVGKKRSFDEVVLPGDPVFGAFSQGLMSIVA